MKKCNADDELRRENSMGGHSSIGRATDSKSVGSEFESLWPHFHFFFIYREDMRKIDKPNYFIFSEQY